MCSVIASPFTQEEYLLERLDGSAISGCPRNPSPPTCGGHGGEVGHGARQASLLEEEEELQRLLPAAVPRGEMDLERRWTLWLGWGCAGGWVDGG